MSKGMSDWKKALQNVNYNVRAAAVRNCKNPKYLIPLIYDHSSTVLLELASRLPIEFVPLMLVVLQTTYFNARHPNIITRTLLNRLNNTQETADKKDSK